MSQPYDSLDIERLVEAALETFCAAHEITGRVDKQNVLKQIAASARELKGRQ